jgi:hypothetical protein
MAVTAPLTLRKPNGATNDRCGFCLDSMKKTIATCLNVLLALVGGMVPLDIARAASVPGLFNTGVEDTGAVLPAGATDPHYALTSPASGAEVFSSVPSAWMIPPAGARWIGPLDGNQGAAVGSYSYTLTFDLTGLDPVTTVITGALASDNNARILLNGIEIGFSNDSAQFRRLTEFTLETGFQPGLNTLEFLVLNNPGTGQNPSGLLVAELAVVPEPLPGALLAMDGVVGVWLWWRRTNRWAISSCPSSCSGKASVHRH